MRFLRSKIVFSAPWWQTRCLVCSAPSLPCRMSFWCAVHLGVMISAECRRHRTANQQKERYKQSREGIKLRSRALMLSCRKQFLYLLSSFLFILAKIHWSSLTYTYASTLFQAPRLCNSDEMGTFLWTTVLGGFKRKCSLDSSGKIMPVHKVVLTGTI
jgi:hypothetical protein